MDNIRAGSNPAAENSFCGMVELADTLIILECIRFYPFFIKIINSSAENSYFACYAEDVGANPTPFGDSSISRVPYVCF